MRRDQTTLSELARLGFAGLSGVRALLDELDGVVTVDVAALLPQFGKAANPDQALDGLVRLGRAHPEQLNEVFLSTVTTNRAGKIDAKKEKDVTSGKVAGFEALTQLHVKQAGFGGRIGQAYQCVVAVGGGAGPVA